MSQEHLELYVIFCYADHNDFNYLSKNDCHIPSDVLQKKINERQIIIVRRDSDALGFLRFGMFWDSVPFMYMLYIGGKYRKKGIGKRLVFFWEAEMNKQGYKEVMTSTQSDESAQHFYRKIGYREIGSLISSKEPLEIIFHKKL